MTFTTYLSGDLIGMIEFARTSTKLCNYIVIYTFVAYIAISVHMNVVKRFGGVSAVLVATGRKGMTLVLSFLLFPKSFSWFYVMGAIMVLGSLLLSSLVKIRDKKKKNLKQQQQQPILAAKDGDDETMLMSPLIVSDGSVKDNDDSGVVGVQDTLELTDHRRETQTSNGGGLFGWTTGHKHQN
jgi:hypothetical protein